MIYNAAGATLPDETKVKNFEAGKMSAFFSPRMTITKARLLIIATRDVNS
ncbi:hypothetical protein [Methylocella sp. CPCC 101449]|nr:hypothetical protein [Methylocella sp. CPCC 101449]MDT2021913.1 hypothetical protein [Methylocella sp. CPCC 101449]